MSNIQTQRRSEKGNVLFLILIAVALFAALSYVVTQSTRSGGGSTEREKNILSSAQMTQYPTALRTSIIRMVLAGVAIENVKFDAPASSGPFTTISAAQLVFHPQGGGATYQDGPSELSSTGNSQLRWFYNANFYVPGIGIDSLSTGSEGNDVIAFLPNVSSGVCRQVNEELGIKAGGCTASPVDGVPQVAAGVSSAADSINENLDDANGFPTTAGVSLECASGAAFSRQASGCFYDPTGSALNGGTAGPRYVFYSVLLER